MQAEAIIRGDLAHVRTGRYCIISKEAVIRPPYKKFSKGSVFLHCYCFKVVICYFYSVAFFPLTMGEHVYIGEKSIVNAAIVGSHVYIGKNCVIVSKICESESFVVF